MEWTQTLYTLTGKQCTRYWKINVIEENSKTYIVREYGKYQGKPIINKKEVLVAKSQPNLYQQAVFEARNEWLEKCNKKGYVTDLSTLTNTSTQLGCTHDDSNQNKITVMIKPLIKPIILPQSQPQTQSKSLITPVIISQKQPQPLITPVIMSQKQPQPLITPVIISQKQPISITPQTQPQPITMSQPKCFKMLPMLANKFSERKKYISYPCMVQPKLDGVRYTAHHEPSVGIILKTRNDAICPFFHEIKKALTELQISSDVYLDGEFYSTKIPFRTLNGYCNRKKMDGKTGYSSIPREHLDNIHYHLFDCYFIQQPNKPFTERYDYLKNIMSNNHSQYIKLVPCKTIQNENEIMPLHDEYVSQGYEGIMIRNINSPYKLKDRSNDLLKYKNFIDSEFEIVDASAPETGKECGCIIYTLLVPSTQQTFMCRPRDTYESRQKEWTDFLQHPEHFIGQQYTVRYQETYETGIPRFPVGVAIRHDL